MNKEIFFCKDKASLITPERMIHVIGKKRAIKGEDLKLKPVSIITFMPDDHSVLIKKTQAKPMAAWIKRYRNVYQGNYKGTELVLAQSAFGAPNVVMLLEELAAFGVRYIFVIGYCGSIQADIRIGDLIIPTDTIREEGTSFHYVGDEKSCRPDINIQNSFYNCSMNKKKGVYMGKVWTTDAPYRETKSKITRYQGQAALGVDMEMSAVFALAQYRGLNAGGALTVSDELSGSEWKPGFFRKEVNNTRHALLEITLEVVEQFSQSFIM